MSAPEVVVARPNNEAIGDVFASNRGQGFMSQAKALFIKSAIVQRRQYRTNCCQMFFPLVMIMLLFVLQVFVNNIIQTQYGTVSPAVVTPISSQQPFLFFSKDADACKAPNEDPPIDDMQGRMLVATNGVDAPTLSSWLANMVLPSLGYIRAVVAFPALHYYEREGDPTHICYQQPHMITKLNYTYTGTNANAHKRLFSAWGNPNDQFIGGLEVNKLDFANGVLRYDIMTNSSFTANLDVYLMASLLTGAVYRQFQVAIGTALPLPPNYEVTNVGIKGFPKAETPISFDLISLVGPQIYIYVFVLLLPVFIATIVNEKEYKLLEIMKMMGLRVEVHFVVTYVFNFLMYCAAMTLLVLLTVALGFRFFTANAFGAYFILLFIWGHLLCAFAALIANFFNSTRTATVVGYLIVFVGGLFCQSIQDYLVNGTTGTKFLLQLFPSFCLYRGLIELSNGVSYGGSGLQMADLSSPDVHLVDVYIFMICEWVVFLLLTYYCGKVFPSGDVQRKHPLFCLKRKRRATNNSTQSPIGQDAVRPKESEDVAKQRALVMDTSRNFAVRLFNLRKVYVRSSGEKKVAVHDLCLGIPFGEALGFLGSNGAGKSTTLSMLCGYITPTSGTATIFGKDITTDMDEIHTIMGVCSQDNVLWGDMTGGEHLAFYGSLKGLTGSSLEKAIVDGLHSVELGGVRNKKSMEYSGGMKRRLCVAISLIGDPKVVLLDEPTTGLDPAARRNLWTVINKAKKTCAMMMTTHSMEEAENLCDSLGIFERGRLSCIGSSSELKTRFENGYKLTVTADMSMEAQVLAFVKNVWSDAVLLNSLGGTMNFEVPTATTKLSTVFELMEKNAAKLKITDWCISNTTLEEVFVRIATGMLDDNVKPGMEPE